MRSPKNKILIIIIVVLLISNIALLGFMFFGKKSDRKLQDRGRSFSDYFEKQLGFTPEQSAQFEQLTTQHFENLRPFLKDVRKAKDSMFSLMRLPQVPDSVLQNAAESLAQKEKAQELLSYRHFLRVRELCTEEQKPKFDTLISRMINRSYGRPSSQKGQQGKNQDSATHK